MPLDRETAVHSGSSLSEVDSGYAWWRLILTLVLGTVACVGNWSVVVLLPIRLVEHLRGILLDINDLRIRRFDHHRLLSRSMRPTLTSPTRMSLRLTSMSRGTELLRQCFGPMVVPPT
jgi:hypothetical protein